MSPAFEPQLTDVSVVRFTFVKPPWLFAWSHRVRERERRCGAVGERLVGRVLGG